MGMRVRSPPRLRGDKMDSRDLWENQVNLITRQCRILSEEMEKMEARISYFENVIFTLLVALKEGGVIVDSDESSDKTYEFSEE